MNVRSLPRILLLASAMLLGAAPSFAQSAARQPTLDVDVASADEGEGGLVEEYFVTESAFLQNAGEFQITSGLTLTRAEDGRWTVPLSVEYGITKRFQVGIEFPIVTRMAGPDGTVRIANGLELEALYGLRREGGSLAVSVGVAVELEAGDDDDEARRVEIEPFICIARRVGRAEFQGNFGAGFGDTRTLVYSAAAAVPARDWRFRIEVAGESGTDGRLVMVPGVARRLPGDAEISIGFPINVGQGVRTTGIVFRTTFEFSRGSER